MTAVTPEQATELVNLAIRTQDHELANFARYCQSVAATTGFGVEPSPGKILSEIEKGRAELQQQGRARILSNSLYIFESRLVSLYLIVEDTGPGYGAAFASVSKSQPTSPAITPAAAPPLVKVALPEQLPAASAVGSSTQ